MGRITTQSTMSEYKICREGQELGSFEKSQIQEGLQTGYFLATDWGWSEGMTDWQALPELLGASMQPAAVSAAPKARPVSSPSSIGTRKPSGTTTSSLNPYAAPTAKTQGGGAIGAVPYPIIAELSGTKPWVRFISVLMWIVCVIFILIAVFTLRAQSALSNVMAQTGNGSLGWGMLIGTVLLYGVSALLIIYPTLKLTKYASNISRLAQSQSFTDLTAALTEQRRFWKFYGIITLIYLGFALVFMLLALAGAGMGFMAR